MVVITSEVEVHDSTDREPEERVVLVDASGCDAIDPNGVVRTWSKLDAHKRGLLHRAVSVFVFNGDHVLLQKRAVAKYHSGGKWSNTCCTHPRVGELPADAAARRLREEMGVVCALKEAFAFTYRAEVGNELIENEFDHVFIGHWSGEPVICLDEVSDWAWWSTQRLLREVEEDPAKFTYWLRDCLGKVLSHPAVRTASLSP